MPQKVPGIGEDVTALMEGGQAPPPVGTDVSALMSGEQAQPAPLAKGVNPAFLRTETATGLMALLDRLYNAGHDTLAPLVERGANALGSPYAPTIPFLPKQVAPTVGKMVTPQSAGDIALMAGGPFTKTAGGLLATKGTYQALTGSGLMERGQGAIQALLGLLGVHSSGSAPDLAAIRDAIKAGTLKVDPAVAAKILATEGAPIAEKAVGRGATEAAAAAAAAPAKLSVEDAMAKLAAAQAAQKARGLSGHAEPPILARPSVTVEPTAAPVPRIVEPVTGTGVTMRGEPAIPPVAAEAPRAPVVFDSRLNAEPITDASGRSVLGAGGFVGPERRAAVRSPGTETEKLDADFRAQRERFAANFKQTSQAAQDNRTMAATRADVAAAEEASTKHIDRELAAEAGIPVPRSEGATALAEPDTGITPPRPRPMPNRDEFSKAHKVIGMEPGGPVTETFARPAADTAPSAIRIERVLGEKKKPTGEWRLVDADHTATFPDYNAAQKAASARWREAGRKGPVQIETVRKPVAPSVAAPAPKAAAPAAPKPVPAPKPAPAAVPPAAAAEAGRAKLQAQMPEGATVSPDQAAIGDKLGAEYRRIADNYQRVKNAFREGKANSSDVEVAKLAYREAGKALRKWSLQTVADATASKIRPDAGFTTPELLRFLGGTTAGSMAGAEVDPEHPVAGAVMGALLGAHVGAPGAMSKVYISGLLSSPTTHVSNILSTTANGLLSSVDKMSAALISIGRAPENKVYAGETFIGAIHAVKGLRQGASDAIHAFMTGQRPQAFSTRFASGNAAVSELPGGLKNPLNWSSRALDAEDVIMGRILQAKTLSEEAYAYLRRQGYSPLTPGFWQRHTTLLAHPPRDLSRRAVDEANRVLFRQDLPRALETLNSYKVQYPALSYLFAFVKVPYNIGRTAVEHSPLGFLKKLPEGRAGSEQLGRALTGTAALGSMLAIPAVWAAIEGRITGSGPKTPAEREMWSLEGNMPHAIKIGNRWYKNDVLGPIGPLLSSIADGHDQWLRSGGQDDATLEDQVQQTATKIGSTFVAQGFGFLRDLQDLNIAFNDPERGGRWINRKLAAVATPGSSLLRRITGLNDTDENGRQILRDPQSSVEAFMANLPGLSKQIPPALDLFGEPKTRDLGPMANTPLSPILALTTPASSAIRPNDVIQMLREAGHNKGKPSGRKTVKGQELPLTPKEERDLIRLRGQLNKSVYSSLSKNEFYRKLPPELQNKILDRLDGKIERARNPYELQLLLQLRQEAQQAAAPGR